MLSSLKYGVIKSKKKISTLVKKGWMIDDLDDHKILYEWYKIPKNIDENYLTLCVLQFYRFGLKKLKYMVDVYPNFKESQYKKYLSYKSKNPKDTSSENFFINKYGLDNYKKIYNNYKTKFRNRITPYNIQYWINKGFSKKESINKIKKYKKDKNTSLVGFINRHGKDEGTRKYNEWVDKCTNTHEDFVKRYGEKRANEISKSKRITKEKMILKYGVVEGLKRYDNWIDGCTNTHEDLVNKYGEKKANEIKKSKINTLEKFIKKYGEEDGKIKYKEYLHKKTTKNNGKPYSKSATNLFKEVVKEMNLYKYNPLFSDDGINELILYKEDKKCYMYDFFIVVNGVKIIIEYHGVIYHPKTKTDSPEKFAHLKTKKDVENKYNYDRDKINYAIKLGYKVLEIWSDEKNKKQKIKKYLYENKIN